MIAATALRLACIAALTNGGDIQNATIAGELVFDSRLDPFSDLTTRDRLPTIIVSTGEISGSPNPGTRGFPFDVTIDLEIEIAVSTFSDQDGSILAQTVDSEPEMELVLDRLQAQVRSLLHGPGSGVWGDLFRQQARAINSFSSVRFATEAGRAKTANRLLKLEVRICEDPATEAPVTTPTGIFTVPQPLAGLAQTILERADPESSLAIYTAQLIEVSGSIPTIVPPVSHRPVQNWKTRYQIDSIDLVDPSLAPNHVGPDGHVEHTFETTHVQSD